VTKTLSCRDGETARHDPRTQIRTDVPHSPLERLKIDDWNQVSGMMQPEVSYRRARATSTKTDSDERQRTAPEKCSLPATLSSKKPLLSKQPSGVN
jgi:hypothetical protein